MIERIILTTAELNQLIIDPFGGSGTTAKVAQKLGFYSLNFEIDSTKIKYTDRIKINSPDDAFEVLWELWDKEIIEFLEEVKILLLNRANQVLCYVDLSKGGTTGSVIDTKVVLQYALKANAAAVIMTHNHPSGNLSPSE